MFDWLEYREYIRKTYDNFQKEINEFVNYQFDRNIHMGETEIFNKPSEEVLDKIANMEIPSKGRDPLIVGQELVNDVFGHSMTTQHPRFFSFVASAVSPYSLAGSILTDMYNIHAGAFDLAPGAGLIEEKIVKWMGTQAGYTGDKVGGVFLSGGSMCNMSAMVAARENKLTPEEFSKGVIYISDQTHSSNEKGLKIIGFRKDQIVKIPTDDDFKMRTDLLEEAIKKDLEEGKKPFAVIGTIGTTNTGSIDPLDKIGEISNKYNLWFHIDGAFGASILISPKYRNLAKGVELSDSLSWDTHKWLMQTYSCSTLVVKNKNHLLNAFTEHPEYLEDVISKEHNDSWDLGPEMSRPPRAIKLWYTLQATGTDLLADVIEYSFIKANYVKDELEKLPNWKIISKPSCGTINFRYEPEGLSEEELNTLTLNISKEIIDSGFAYIVTTILRNKKTLRMCMTNANTTMDDIEQTINLLDKIAKEETEKLRNK